MYMKKHRRKSRQTKFWKRARPICNLHSCYMRMHSFSANQKRVIFFHAQYKVYDFAQVNNEERIIEV